MRICVHTPPGYVHHPYRPDEPWSLDDSTASPSSSSSSTLPVPYDNKSTKVEMSTGKETKEGNREEPDDDDAWLQTGTDNPYIEVSMATLVNLLPAMSIWIKYRNLNGEKRQGGVLTFNAAPNYIKLYNRYTRKSFSVQVKDNVLYARKRFVEQSTPKTDSCNTQPM